MDKGELDKLNRKIKIIIFIFFPVAYVVSMVMGTFIAYYIGFSLTLTSVFIVWVSVLILAALSAFAGISIGKKRALRKIDKNITDEL